jgi:tetratricopeptide (TPR) repeat protein
MQRFISVIILFILLLGACQKVHNFDDEFRQVKKIEEMIDPLPVQDRLRKWDSLINSGKFTEYQLAFMYFDKGNAYSDIFADKKAIKLFNKALTLFKKYQNKQMIAKAYINLGISYAFIDKKASATENVFNGLRIAEELQDELTISRAYSELAHIYYLYNDKDKSIEYLNKTGKIQEKLKDSLGLSSTYNNISIIYKEMGKLQEAYDFALKALKIDEKMNNEIYLVNSYNTLGALVYKLREDGKEALKYYKKSYELSLKNKLLNPVIFENLSNLYYDMGKQDSAMYFIRKAIDIHSDNIQDNIRLYNRLLYLKLKRNKQDEAIGLLKIKDSLLKLEKELEKSEDKKSIENNINLLVKQKQLKQARELNKKNRIIFIFIIVIFVLGILISYQLNRFDKLKYKQEKFILEQKVLRSQMNPHFIFNVLSSIQNTLIENNPIKSATYLSKFAQLIRQNFDYVRRQRISLKEEIDILESYLDTQQFRYKDKFDYIINIDPKIDEYETKVPPMILQPFVENAIEHGFKNIDYKAELVINIFIKNGKLCFEIIDNGTGYHPKPDDREHALDIFQKRMELLGKEEADSYKIENLKKGVKVTFCFSKKTFLPDK